VDRVEAHNDVLERQLERAIDQVERALANGPYTYRRVDAEKLSRSSLQAPVVAAWTILHRRVTDIPTLDVAVDPWFPASLPKFYIPDALLPDGSSKWFLRIPHVNKNGSICLVPESSTIDRGDCGAATLELTKRAIDLLNEGISGANKDDFIAEVESYWAQISDARRIALTTSIAPPTRWVTAAFDKARGTYFIAENADTLRLWMEKFSVRESPEVFDALFVWRQKPLYPNQYPKTNHDLLCIVAETGLCAASEVARRARLVPRDLPVLISFACNHGPALIGASVKKMNGTINGFREKSITGDLVLRRFGPCACALHAVDRTHPDYIYWRSNAARNIQQVSTANVMIVGCGALGADVAMLLVKAGVRNFTLVDPDWLRWDNIGRHILGARYVGFKKVDALETALTSHSPHVDVQIHVENIETLIRENPGLLAKQDLIISMTADCVGEEALNGWAKGKKTPVVFGWLEPHGIVGQCVLVAFEGGCFACGKEASGQFVERVLNWQADQSVQVPACGGVFTPHGAIDSSPTKSMMAQLAIDCLTGNVARSELRTFIGDLSKITNLGGTVRPGWEKYVQDPSVTTRLVVKPWDPNPNCRHCQDHD
jgi:hypothetical protein